MAKRFTKLLAALALLIFMTPSMVTWGQTSVTWPGTTALPGTATAVANDQNVTIMVSSTNTYSNPIRIYANTTVTINALNNAKILSVAYEASSTGNYVSNAQNATVTPNVTPTVSGKIVTWTYAESANVTAFTFTPSAQTRSNGITITYIIPGATPICATPTFNPAAGTYTQAQSVSISCSTDGATIYYTTDGNDPTTNSTVYSEAINVSTNTTIKAMAVKSGYDNSAVASATYTIVTPMTIAEVRAQQTGDVITTGTVTSCVGTTGYIQDATAAICVYGTSLNVGDNISVVGSLTNYNGLLEITNPQVTVISSGNTINPELMTIAQVVASTNQGWYIRIEDATVTAISDKNVTIAQGNANVVVRFANASDITFEVNNIISLNGNIGAYNGVQIANPQNVTVHENLNPFITAEDVSIASDATNGSITYIINNPATNGAMAAATASDWLTLGTSFDSPIAFTCTANTATTARTATVVLTYTYNTNQTVTKEVTVTQAAYEAPHVTWDLSIASYDEVTDPDLVTWSSNYATMTNATGTGSTSASNYLGGDTNNRTSTRFYANNVLTLSPAAGYAITSVVFTATTTGYASALTNSTWTNATASADGTTVTVTPTDGTTAMVATIGATCGFTSVTVYYVVNNAPSITANNVEITYDTDADEIEYVINNPVSDGSLVASTESDWLEVDDEPVSGNAGTIEFTCSVNTAANTRTAIVTLTYTYNRAIVIKEVTVTQAGNPNATMTIAEVREQGTGDVVTTGTVTSFSVNSSNNTTAYIQDATAAIVVFGEFTVAVGDEIMVSGTLSTYHGLLEIINPEVTVISQSNTVTPELMTIAQAVANTNQGWYIRIEDATVTEIDGLNTTIAQDENTIVVRGISGVEYAVNDVLSFNGNIGCYDGNQIVNPQNIEVQAVPSITITPDNFELDANSHMAEVLTAITYKNIVVEQGSGVDSFEVQYYDAENHEIESTWCTVGAVANETGFDLAIFAGPNEGEARTVYFKLVGHDEDNNLVYSNLVTVTQAALVIDYAVLKFEWEGGPKADFLALNGVTAHGLGSDYASNNAPYLIKFDGDGDYIQVKCDQQPGKVTIGVKMIGGGETSTITIQGSADGETFTDIDTLTISGAQGDELTLETTNVFADADRYVRMLFTKGSNVGVGPITIEKGSAPSITVTPATLDLEAAGTINVNQIQQVDVTYHNLAITQASDFAVQFYNEEGEEQAKPNWILNDNVVVSGGNDTGYFVMLIIAENTSVARSAYFKVYALGEEDYVYSNLVTINQAGVVPQYTLTVEPFENLELITFVNDEMVMEGDGEIQVNEGDQIMLSVVAMEGYVMETLVVNGVDHVNDIADDFTYSFEMPAENVTISATAVEDVPSTGDEYALYTGVLVEGDYLIVYDGGAMNTTVTNDRLQYEEVAATNDVIVTDKAEIVWHIAPIGEYWTIYNVAAQAYAASTGAKNKAQMLANGTDDKALWTVSGTETYEFVNKANSEANVNANLRKNGTYGFACYATSTGGALSLYKKVESGTSVTQTISLSEGENWVSFNVATTLDDLKDALLNALDDDAANIKITSQSNGYTDFDGSTWRGTLNPFDVSQMFVIEVTGACEISLEAMPVNPARPITIVNGTNWIGFPFSESMSLSNAFSNFAENGDKILAPNGTFATYNGSNWVGELETLQPGQGYKYEVTTTGERSLVFPSYK